MIFRPDAPRARHARAAAGPGTWLPILISRGRGTTLLITRGVIHARNSYLYWSDPKPGELLALPSTSTVPCLRTEDIRESREVIFVTSGDNGSIRRCEFWRHCELWEFVIEGYVIYYWRIWWNHWEMNRFLYFRIIDCFLIFRDYCCETVDLSRFEVVMTSQFCFLHPNKFLN